MVAHFSVSGVTRRSATASFGTVFCPAKAMGPVHQALSNQHDELLAFTAQRDEDLAALARQRQVPVAMLREMFNTEGLD